MPRADPESPAANLFDPESLLKQWRDGALLGREDMNLVVKHLSDFRANMYALMDSLATSARPCTRCTAHIWFLPTGKTDEKGKPILVPVSPAGQSHFKDCPHAAQFQRRSK